MTPAGDDQKRYAPIPVVCHAHPVELTGDLHGMLEVKRALLLAISHELRSPLTRARLSGAGRGAEATPLSVFARPTGRDGGL